MTEEMKKALLDLRARQESGEHMPCPRCGLDRMKPRLYTNALSRHADGIFVCDECGSHEAMLDFMNNPLPLEDWAVFNPDQPRADFKDTPGEEAWKQIQEEQAQVLVDLFRRWLTEKPGAAFKPYRREAVRRCPGLTMIWNEPFAAVYKVAEGDLVLRFKNTENGVQLSMDILHFAK